MEGGTGGTEIFGVVNIGGPTGGFSSGGGRCWLFAKGISKVSAASAVSVFPTGSRGARGISLSR